MKITRLLCVSFVTAMLFSLSPAAAYANAEEGVPLEFQTALEGEQPTEAAPQVPAAVQAAAQTLNDPEAFRITAAYSAAFPQGTVVGGPFFLTLTYYNETGAELTPTEVQPHEMQLDELLEVSLPTSGRANAVFAYDEDTGDFSFVASVSDTNSVTALVNSPKPLIAVSNTVEFQDAGNHWAKNHILIAARKGLVTGTGNGKFEPDRSITKAEFSRLIAQSLQLPAPETGSVSRFTDVIPGAWYYDSLRQLQAAGVLDAFTSSAFFPNEPITREEMAVMLAGAMDYLKIPPVVSSDSLSVRFTDAGTVSPAYLSGVERVTGYGVMNGMTASEFAPQGNTTRAQSAVAVTGMLRKFNFIDPINFDFDLSELYSTAAVVLDLSTNTDLLSKNQDAQVYPASLTKLMTGIVILENWDQIPETITLDPAIFPALKKAQSSMAGFSEGETVSKEDLLYGTMLKSGGEATLTMAMATAGSEAEFVNLMNAKAQELGLTSTHFTNPTGLHDSQHYTTIRDLKTLFLYAMKNEQFYQVITTRYYNTQPTSQHPNGIYFENGIFDRFEGTSFVWGNVLGGKTGYTGEAGQCLASLVEKNGNVYMMITTGNGIKPFGMRYYTADVATVYTNFIMQ